MKTTREWAREVTVRLDMAKGEVSAEEVIECVVREAIAAERERCAKIADWNGHCGPHYDEHKDECHDKIAEAIRKDSFTR